VLYLQLQRECAGAHCGIIFHRLRNNEDLATHDGLCTTHHVQLNIDKSVERLTKRDGKSRARLTPRGKRREEQKKDTKKDGQKKKTGRLFSVTEIADIYIMGL
jgi:hypothetical protein